jgi:hypothetical protein
MSTFKGTLMDPGSPAFYLQVRPLSWLLTPIISFNMILWLQRLLGFEDWFVFFPFVFILCITGYMIWYRRKEKKHPPKLGTMEVNTSGIIITDLDGTTNFFDFESIQDLKSQNLDVHNQSAWASIKDELLGRYKIPTIHFTHKERLYRYTFTIESIFMYNRLTQLLQNQELHSKEMVI